MNRHQRKNWLLLSTLFFAVFLCIISFSTMKTSADDSSGEEVIVYDAADFDYLSSRTKEEVINRYSEALAAGKTFVDGSPSTYYITAASTTYPYNAGVLSADTLEAMAEMSNFYRWLIGVEPLEVNQTSDSRMQAEALLRNFQFAHYISESSRPADMDDETWQAGYACTHNILSSGFTATGAISVWLNEGYSLSSQSWDTLGHRSSILSAENGSIIYGYSGRVAIGKCGSTVNTFTIPFAAFPAAGYMPSNLISRAGAAWTVQLNTNIVTAANPSNVVVTVTNLDTGYSYECTSANNYAIVGSTISFRQPSDGESVSSSFTDPYRVEITGLTDVVTGKEAKICYTVDFFNMYTEYPLLTSANISFSKYDYCYTGEEIIPEYTVTYYGKTLTEGIDYDVEYYNNVDPGAGIVTIIGKGQYRGARKNVFTIHEDTKNMEDCRINLSTTTYTYSGSECTPSATVTYYGETLEQGKDYEITYTDNINAGNATAIVTGIGDYHGVVEKSFTIKQKDAYPAIHSKPDTLEKGETYQMDVSGVGEITYQSSDESIFTVDENGLLTAVSAGSAKLTVTVLGDMNHKKGSTTITIKVSEDIHKMQVIALADGANNIAKRKCLVCGKEEEFTTMTSFNLWWWTGPGGTTYLSSDQYEGEVHYVSVNNSSPADAEDKSIELFTSDESIMKVKNNYFGFVGVGTVTLTVRAVNNPSVKIEKTFTVSHYYDEGVRTLEPTCTEPGKIVYTCSVCGDIHAEEIPALGHSEEVIVGKAATCTETGITDGKKCSVCGEMLVAQEEIPALGHTEEIIPGKAATCTEAGITDGKKCSVCGEMLVAQEEIPAFGHTEEVLSAKKANCTENGLTEGSKCSVCGEILLEQEVIPALGHKEDVIPGKPATCTEDGLTEGKKCTVCGETLLEQEVIPALGHSYTSEVVKDATCTEGGSQEKVCSVCGDRVTETIPALGHRWNDFYTIDKEATTKEEGLKSIHCAVCGEVKPGSEQIIPKQQLPSGWYKEDGIQYYVNNDGTFAKGWIKLGMTWYYLDENTGAMETGIIKVGNKFYYLEDSGAMKSNCWINDDGTWYYAQASGALATGWLQSGSTWYYMDPSTCAMTTGWVKVGNSWYYMNPSGAMATGWVKVGDTWYYMSASGAMTTGWVKVGDTWYYMKASGAMAANEWVIGYYWISGSGAWTYQPVGSWKQNSTGWWFGDTSGWYAKNETIKINDVLYTFNAAGYWVK